MSLWWVLAGLGCLLVLGFVILWNFDSNAGDQIGSPTRIKMRQDIDEIPISEFVVRSEEILPELAELLDIALKNQEGDFAKFIRGGEESAERWKAWKARKQISARHHPTVRRQLHAAVIGGAGYLVLAGLDANHLEAVAYFVKEADEFKFDWEASEGFSELLPTEVEQLADDEPKLMRGVAAPANFYTTHFPEEEFQAYTLHHQDPGDFVWGFAKRSSDANTKMMASYAGVDLAGTRDRVTVKVRRGPEGARANQLEIVEFLHSDWFTPNSVSVR